MSTFTPRRDFLALLGLAAAAVSCGTANSAAPSGQQVKKLRYQGWAGQVTLPELAADLGYLGDVKLDWVGNTISGPQDIQSAATGQTDFGGAFNGAVVKLVAAHAPIRSVIGYYGVDKQTFSGFYVRGDSPVRSARDLIGKKVAMNTLGAHAEAMLDIYLTRHGFSKAELAKVERVVLPPVNTEQALREHQIEVAVLTGIFRDKALAKGGIRPLFSDYELLGTFTAGSYVFTDRFIKQNPDTVRTFVTGVAKAIEWSRTTPREQVVDRMAKIVEKRGRKEDTAALKYWKSNGVAGTGGRISDKEFSIWIDWLQQRGVIKKGEVTASDVYTNEFNGYTSGSKQSGS